MVSAPSALPPNVQLLVASLDLKLVQLLRDAIRTADLSTAAHRATDLGPAPSPEPRRHYHPEPVYEPRAHYHPTPRIEPRPVWYVAPSASAGRCWSACPAGAGWADCSPTAAPAKPDCERPMEPPWKVLPWQNPPPPPRVQKVKVRVYRPDTAQKGAAIDLFV